MVRIFFLTVSRTLGGSACGWQLDLKHWKWNKWHEVFLLDWLWEQWKKDEHCWGIISIKVYILIIRLRTSQYLNFILCIYMSLCQKVLGEDHPFFGPKCFFRFKFSLNKPNFIWKSMHQRDNKDKLDSQSQFWVSKIWKFTPSPGRKSAKEGWTFRVHRFSCRLVCIFLL